MCVSGPEPSNPPMGSADSECFLMASFPGMGSLPLDRWRWNTTAPPWNRTGHTAGKEDTNLWSRTGQDFLTFSITLLSQASAQSREPEWECKAPFNRVMLYALPYPSWQGALWLGKGCWKAHPALLIWPQSAKGVFSQQCLISGLQRTRAVTEVDVFGFPWLETGRCVLSAHHCLPWLSGVLPDQQKPGSCIEWQGKRRNLPFLDSQRWMQRVTETVASVGPAADQGSKAFGSLRLLVILRLEIHSSADRAVLNKILPDLTSQIRAQCSVCSGGLSQALNLTVMLWTPLLTVRCREQFSESMIDFH